MTTPSSVDRENRVNAIEKWAARAAIVAVLFVSLVVIQPSLPKKIVLLTGPEGGNYHEIGKRYAAELRSRGLETELVVTDGGLDNLQRLVDGAEATVAFVPSNLERAVDPPIDVEHLVSLGSVAYEPLWFFFRSDLEVHSLRDCAVLTLSTGDDDTVVNWMAKQFLAANGIADTVSIVGVGDQPVKETTDALLGGRIQGAFVMGVPVSPAVEKLLHDDRVGLLSFARADAYVALFPGLTKLVAPEGVFDLVRNVPPHDTQLLSATTNLVTRDSLHPAVVPLLLSSAASFYDEGNVFASSATFPSRVGVSLPLKRAANRYYDQGETGLSRQLPYALARALNHFGFVVLPLCALAFILVKVLPVAMQTWTKIRLVGLYKRLEAVEKADAAGTDRVELVAELRAIDDASSTIFVPRSKLSEYIDFRQFLHDMRDRIASGDERKAETEVLDDGS